MLVNVFLVSAAVGGSVMVAQLLAGLVGVGGHGADHDGAHLGDHGGDHGGHGHGASPWLGLFSLRALATGLAFFGLGGLSSIAGGLAGALALALALMSGAGGAALVVSLQRALGRLRADGTLRLEGAVGRSATVYLGIPADRQGVGKVTLVLQDRTIECEAVTSQGALPTGSRVLVVDVVAPGRLAVEPDPLPADPARDRDNPTD